MSLVDGDGVVLDARVSRTRDRSGLCVIIDDLAQLRLFPDRNLVFLQTKAHDLWSLGLEAWMTTWLDRATFFAMGKPCARIEDTAAIGWSVDRLELAADFVGLEFTNDDAQRFVGVRRGKKKLGIELIRSSPSRIVGQVETIDIGKRRKNGVCVSTHDKSQKIRNDGGSPAASVYAPTWRANGWEGVAVVRRVEVRARGRALVLRSSSKSKVVDLRDPASLLNENMLGAFWRYATTHRARLVDVPPGTIPARMRRAPTDPRWAVVQNAGGLNTGLRLTQQPREASRLGLTERRSRALDTAARALGRYAGLHGGVLESADLDALIRQVMKHPEFVRELDLAATRRRESSVDPDVHERRTYLC